MYTLNFSLRQQTPLIHFLHEQDNVTLRSTQVKPLLDKHLIKWCFQGDMELYKGYLKGKTASLDYRIDFLPNGEPEKYLFSSQKVKDWQINAWKNKGIQLIGNTPYFGNEKNLKDSSEEDVRLAIMHNEDCRVTLLSPHKKLLEEIDRNIDAFFVLNNFGTRANKGFGSFIRKSYLADANIHQKIVEVFFSHQNENLFCNVLPPKFNNISGIFGAINLSYKKLKGGINGRSRINDFYSNRQINGKPVVWEKIPIKEEIIKNRNIQTLYTAKDNERYIRVLLGLAELYDFPEEDVKVKIKCLNQEIQRVTSPLYFKVIGNTIYLTASQIPDKIYGQQFEFSTDDKKMIISSPPSNLMLDINKFLFYNLDKKYWKEVKPIN